MNEGGLDYAFVEQERRRRGKPKRALKPCPVCGGHISIYLLNRRYFIHADARHLNDCRVCDQLPAQFIGEHYEKLADDWNLWVGGYAVYRRNRAGSSGQR